MGWKGNLAEWPVWMMGRCLAPNSAAPPEEPRSILVLRNNDIGDLLVTTPTFAALKHRFPRARIIAGIGRWNTDVLLGNPNVDEIVEVNAPWTNKYTPDQSWGAVGRYLFSDEVRSLASRKVQVGIDVVGSHVGSLLLMRLGIPFRVGVKGYRGGYSACQRYVQYNDDVHVGRASLAQAELLGARVLPPNRPQIFLSESERAEAESTWSLHGAERARGVRVMVGPGGGFPEKRWPRSSFRALVELLGASPNLVFIVVGGKGDRDLGQYVSMGSRRAVNLCGVLSLRQTFALAGSCDVVITNSSMLMHVAAAFYRPTAVTLAEYYPSAAAHDRLWGYPGTCKSLGIEPGKRAGIWRPDEVAQYVNALLHQADFVGRGRTNP